MSRFDSWLNELQPEMFIEISPELAARKWHRTRRMDGGMESARRHRSACDGDAAHQAAEGATGASMHQIGIPFHWGFAGETVGAIANDLTRGQTDPNVSMHEAKALRVQCASRTSGTRVRDGRHCLRRHGLRASARPRRPISDAAGGTSKMNQALMQIASHALRGIGCVPNLPRRAGSRPGSSPIRRCASAARHARWPASNGTNCRPTASLGPATATTTRCTLLGHNVAACGLRRADGSARRRTAPRWLMMSDVCKHCAHAPCEEACPTGSLIYNEFGNVYVQQDICNGCALLRGGLSVRRAGSQSRRRQARTNARFVMTGRKTA